MALIAVPLAAGVGQSVEQVDTERIEVGAPPVDSGDLFLESKVAALIVK